MKKVCAIYVVCAVILLLLPLAGMSVAPTMDTTENKEMAEFPEFVKDGKWNFDYFGELGSYFEDHFAFRREMVSIDAKLRGALFHDSAADKVILGKDGWLYYTGTLDDYQGVNLLSERSLFNIAHTLKLMQGMVESMGSEFYYTVAPNKNTLYPEHMPSNYVQGEECNLENLMPFLESEGVHYIDLKAAFQSQDEVLYLHRDSHWNNKGAVLAYNTICDAIGKAHDDYENQAYEEKTDYIGDLNGMLYPLWSTPEMNQDYSIPYTFEYLGENTDVEDSSFETANPQGEGSLLMYRDSFGNTLSPLMANVFENAFFSKLTPYNIYDVVKYKPQYVIVERVERRISSIIETPPVMQGPSMVLNPESKVDSQTMIEAENKGSYTLIKGVIDPEYLGTKDLIYISVHPTGQAAEKAYEVFGCMAEDEKTGEMSDNGYQLYLLSQNVPEETPYDIDVIRVGEEGIQTLKTITIKD